MPTTSAGILLWRRGDDGVEVLLGHMGGPFWARKDGGAWSFPKGEHGPDEEPVVAKQYASAFFGTTLASTLRAAGVDTVVVAGVSTSGCVRATAMDALNNGFRPQVVRQACADRTPALHDNNLADLDAKYADVVDLPEALAHL